MPCRDALYVLQNREIVAGVVTNGEDMCLVRRSAKVASDRGLWHCITGYLEPQVSPRRQILDELREELGLAANEITGLTCFSPVSIVDRRYTWIIHPFAVMTQKQDFVLNWENDDFRWLKTSELPRRCVPWLSDVLASINLES